MTDTQKIYEWCDRRHAETRLSHALIVFRDVIFGRPTWIASVRWWSKETEEWAQIIGFTRDGEGDTPEEAIAKLAEILGL